jgi:two-component system chemotaxis response regulator CheB
MRKIISDLLSGDPAIEVIGTARDGLDALEKISLLRPDVITLDVEMPRLDGLGALREIMTRFPTPVVMVSSLTEEGADATIKALSLGAVDFLCKPSGAISLNMADVKAELLAKVRGASGAKPRVSPPRRTVVAAEPPAPIIERLGQTPEVRRARQPGKLVVIGCSTGGPGALYQIIPELSANLAAAVVIVQHMPPGFTRSLAVRLNEVSRIKVKEAEEGDRLEEGAALVAPGGYHLIFTDDGRASLNRDPALHGVRPAVDKTLESVVPVWRNRTLGIILTGMGYDGARGMAALKKAGGRTIAEHESTCVVYGMPKVVAEMGNADLILPLQDIAPAIGRVVGEMVG